MNGLQSHSNLTAYILRIAKNLSVDRVRRKRIAKRAFEENISALYSVDGDSTELESAISILIHHLSPLQRTVFLLREVFGFRGVEIARALKMSEGAVKAALHRARTAIVRLKQDHPFQYDGTDQTDEYELLLAYTAAIRETNPNALIALAMAQNGQIDSVQAIGTALRISANNAGMTTNLYGSTMTFMNSTAA